MPAVSENQRQLAGADLRRLRAGKRTRTGMTEAQLREFAAKAHRRRKARKAVYG